MKNVHLITVLSLGYTLLVYAPAFAGNYTQLDLIGFSKDGECVAYQLDNKNSDPAIFQEKLIILDVNNQKIIKTITSGEAAGLVNAKPEQAADQSAQAEPQTKVPEDFNALYTATLEKYRIIEWNKGIAVYQTKPDQTAVYPQLSKEVSFNIKDEKNQAYAYKVVIQKQDAKGVDCEHEFLTYSPSLFTCKIMNAAWETTLSPFASETKGSIDKDRQLPTELNCFRDYFIQSIYIYKNKVVVFIYAGAPASAATGTAGMNWSIITMLGTLNRTYAIIPDAPVLADVTPASQVTTSILPPAARNTQEASGSNSALTEQAASDANADNTGALAPDTLPVSNPQSLQAGKASGQQAEPIASLPVMQLPAPSLEVITPNPDYDNDVYLTWDEVPGATVYKIYRELLPVKDTKQLKPLVVTSDWFYTDKSPKEKKIYWYAITAGKTPSNIKSRAAAAKANPADTNSTGNMANYQAEQESLPSRPRSVCINNDQTSLVFWEDFDTNNAHEPPVGWTSNNNAASAMWFFAHNSWAIPSPQLIVSDNLDNAGVWGSIDLKSTVHEGWFEFDFKLDKQANETGSSEQDYFLYLKSENGKDKVIQLRIHYILARHQYNFILQGAIGKNWFNENQDYHLQLAFGGGKLSLQVDGTPEMSNVNYTAKPVRQLYIETSSSMFGGGCFFDNFALWENKQTKDQKNGPGPLDVHSTAPRTQNRQELFDEHRLTDENMKPDTFNQIGFQLYRQNSLQEALQMFLCSIEQDNNYARGYYNTACMLSLLDERNPALALNPNPEQALRYLESAYRIDPEFVVRAEKDQDLGLVKKTKAFQNLSEKYYYSFNSSDLNIFAEGFARCVRSHRWPDLLNYFEKSYLSEYYDRLYDRKTDLFLCDFFELSSLLSFKAKKELCTYLINQIKDCQVLKQTGDTISFRIVLTTETNNAREITIDLKKRTSGSKSRYGLVRYFPPRG